MHILGKIMYNIVHNERNVHENVNGHVYLVFFYEKIANVCGNKPKTRKMRLIPPCHM